MTTTPLHKQVLSRYSSVQAWLELLGNLGRAPATLDAYGRALAHYLLHCEGSGLKPESATFEQVTLYIRELLPGAKSAVANSTLHQRLTAIRLWYDHLVFRVFASTTPCPADSMVGWPKCLDMEGLSGACSPRLIAARHSHR